MRFAFVTLVLAVFQLSVGCSSKGVMLPTNTEPSKNMGPAAIKALNTK